MQMMQGAAGLCTLQAIPGLERNTLKKSESPRPPHRCPVSQVPPLLPVCRCTESDPGRACVGACVFFSFSFLFHSWIPAPSSNGRPISCGAPLRVPDRLTHRRTPTSHLATRNPYWPRIHLLDQVRPHTIPLDSRLPGFDPPCRAAVVQPTLHLSRRGVALSLATAV